jgi:WhiB family redox-sensing transcriptional regulator
MTSRMVFTYPGGGALQPTDLAVMPRRWGWHDKTKQLCVVMPALNYEKANCVGRDDLFIQDNLLQAQITEAKKLCDACPILKQCAVWGLAHEEFGIWGGTTARERADRRRAIGLRLIEPAAASTYGLSDEETRSAFPDRCQRGHYLKHYYDAKVSNSPRNTPYRTEYSVSCTQCYYEQYESPEARASLSERGQMAVKTLAERGTRNTGKRNKWGSGL